MVDDVVHGKERCVGGCGGVGAGGGQHGHGGIVEFEPGQAVGVLHQVGHDVLAQQVGGALGRRGDHGLGVGLLDLAIDDSWCQCPVHGGVELEWSGARARPVSGGRRVASRVRRRAGIDLDRVPQIEKRAGLGLLTRNEGHSGAHIDSEKEVES